MDETAAPPLPSLSPRDAEHLRLLATFHWVVAAIIAFCGCFPILHVAMGASMLFAPESMDAKNPPPAWFGGVFMVMGLGIMLGMWALAAAVAWSGKCLRERRNWMFSMVVAAVLCLNMPLGTVLGVFTIIVLLRDDVKRAFNAMPA